MKILSILLLSLSLIQCQQEKPQAQSKVAFLKENPTILQPKAFSMDGAPILIKGARIMTAAGTTLEKADLLMEKGRIKKVSAKGITPPQGAQVIEAQGLTLTPGVIDVHSHMGVYPSPSVDAHSDGNESSAPVTSHVWAEHGFWPQDPDLWRALAGGVTTIQVLPGSANLIGGRSFIAKLIPKMSAREMRFPGAKQGLKMACGENPKRVYKDKGLKTRMGNVAGYRKAYQEALEYARQWSEYKKTGKGQQPKRNFISETLVKVLKGDILLHLHCYRADDISAVLDVAKEFGFKVRTIHHGLESYKIADRLAKEDVATATWADWWGFKAEAYDGVPYNAALLQAAGAKAIIHSDSATDIRFLNLEAGKALAAAKKMGLEISEDQALAWITKNAAWALGLEDQIGTIEEGKMADLVLWDGHPFSVYTKAQWVFINGQVAFQRKTEQKFSSDFEVGYTNSKLNDGRQFQKTPTRQQISWGQGLNKLSADASKNFIIRNVKAFIDGQWKENSHLLIEKGVITKISSQTINKNLPTVNGQGKPLTPGLVETDSVLGLVEIAMDSRSQDLSTHSQEPTPGYLAFDAFNSDSVRLAIARSEGILTAISRISGGFAASFGTSFDLNNKQPFMEKTALFGNIQKAWKGHKNRAQIFSEVRQLIDDSTLFNANPESFFKTRPNNSLHPSHLKAMKPIIRGKLPWVLRAKRAGDIRQIIRLKQRYPKIKFVLAEATEAWMLAEEIKAAGLPVMMSPSAQTPGSFDSTKARFDLAAHLHKHQVPLIIMDNNDNGAGRTRQEAGFAVKYGLSKEAAMKAITETPAKVFGLNRGRIQVGAPAHLVLWNGDPLEPTQWAESVWIHGEPQSLWTRQRGLADKYLKKLKK